jgi:hypothetical protein
MTLDSLMSLLNNRLRFLQSQRPISVSVGDVQKVIELDNEIAQTQLTLDQVRSLH